jgi:uncharacterized protein (TIGR02186 family)
MFALFCLGAMLALAPPGQAVAAANTTVVPEALVADLSQHKINISTGFAGTELLLFGVTKGVGDIIVIVSGPDAKAVVRKKSRVTGLWINTDSVEFEIVPGFYHVAATNNLSQTDLDTVLRENGVGFRYLNMAPKVETEPARANEFREALLRRKVAKGLYNAATGKIDVLENALFRTNVFFPANVPTGRYRVDVFHVEDGWVKATTSIPLSVGKVGMEEKIYLFAQEQPALYGVFAILIAAVAGYGAGMLFGRR